MRKIKISTFIILASVILFQACDKSDNPAPVTTEPVDLQLALNAKRLATSSSNFGIELFKAIESTEKLRKNWMISPLSVSLALAMTYNGSDGDTKTAMQNTLDFNDLTVAEVNNNLKQLSETLLQADSKVDISIANSIWYRNGLTVLQDFVTTNQNYYDAKVTTLDFSDAGAKDIINNWVADNTEQKIETIVERIDPSTAMFLINAIYFKGAWKYKFDKTKNQMLPFTNYADAVSNVEMMSQKANLRSFKNDEVSMVEMPYGQGNWVMDLVLPAEGVSTNQLILGLTKDKWQTWTNGLGEASEMIVTLPPFKFEYEESLKTMLANLGMGIAFGGDADFSKITGSKDLFISDVKHKTFVEVNEEGTEAAAVTSVIMERLSVPSVTEVVFNKPFLFVIREQTSGTILFIGKVGEPER